MALAAYVIVDNQIIPSRLKFVAMLMRGFCNTFTNYNIYGLFKVSYFPISAYINFLAI